MRKTLALAAVLTAAVLTGGCMVVPVAGHRPTVRLEPIVIIDVVPTRVYVPPPVIFLPLPYYDYHERHPLPPPHHRHHDRRRGH